MKPEERQELVDRVLQMDQAATPGPWRWNVSPNSKRMELESSGKKRGRETVMGFARWGMSSAQALFCSAQHILENVTEYLVTVPGREHHKAWYMTIDHPDANVITFYRTAAPDLARELRQATEENALLRDVLDKAKCLVNSDHGVATDLAWCDLAQAISEVAKQEFNEVHERPVMSAGKRTSQCAGGQEKPIVWFGTLLIPASLANPAGEVISLGHHNSMGAAEIRGVIHRTKTLPDAVAMIYRYVSECYDASVPINVFNINAWQFDDNANVSLLVALMRDAQEIAKV